MHLLLPALLAAAAAAAPDLYDARLRLKVLNSRLQGPGEHLLHGLHQGDVVARESFATQFVLDIARVTGVHPDRVYVDGLAAPGVHYSWPGAATEVSFRVLNATHGGGPPTNEAVRNLTALVHTRGSALYAHPVTGGVDHTYGLVAVDWDASLRLWATLDVLGGPNTTATAWGDAYVDLGGSRGCRAVPAARGYLQGPDVGLSVDNSYVYRGQDPGQDASAYCEFEAYFRDDVARAAQVSRERVEIQFVKTASLDQTLVHFRVYPDPAGGGRSTADALVDLRNQTASRASALAALGNVTVRLDPAWGLSGAGGVARAADGDRMPRPSRPQSPAAYERDKATQRAPRARERFDAAANAATYARLDFDGGEEAAAALFADFENWRVGTRPFSKEGSVPSAARPPGAHFSAFDFDSLGPTVPTAAGTSLEDSRRTLDRVATDRNVGLVLDRASQLEEMALQQRLLDGLEAEAAWCNTHRETALLDGTLRSRLDVSRVMDARLSTLSARLAFERDRLAVLNRSQCGPFLERGQPCAIEFNTSSLRLTGAISGTGVAGATAAGTEVACFAFDSIRLGPEVTVTVVGQRPLALLSRSSVALNTEIAARPGTLGGMPGGYSIARSAADALSDFPADVRVALAKPHRSQPSSLNNASEPSNNVNGLGAGGAVRVYLKTVTTSAADIDEVQTLTTGADAGQTLEGFFRVSYGAYQTQPVRHNASAGALKTALEEALNMDGAAAAAAPESGDRAFDRRRRFDAAEAPRRAGIGRVDVTRGPRGDAGGYVWTITFVTAVGNVDPLEVTNFMTGIGSRAAVATVRQGNSLGGAFALSFLGATTAPLAHDVAADELAAALVSHLPAVRTAHASRTGLSRGLCGDGLCVAGHGPTGAGGLTWTLTLTTLEGNVSPKSPTDPAARDEGPVSTMTAAFAGLTGAGAFVSVENGHTRGPLVHANELVLDAELPFSLAYGGSGGGHGGRGGDGHGAPSDTNRNRRGQRYNSPAVADLLGGSGGALGHAQPYVAAVLADPTGRGGHGGGAVELVAANDVTLGPHGRILVDGGPGGRSGHQNGGGGGGSGGSIVVSAGGVVRFDPGSLLSAAGGRGGDGADPEPQYFLKPGAPPEPLPPLYPEPKTALDTPGAQGGGGGGGGRVAVRGQALSLLGAVAVEGGACPSAPGRRCEDRRGENGTVHWETAFGIEPLFEANGTVRADSYVARDDERDVEDVFLRHRSQPELGLRYHVDETLGAAGTRRSLRLTSNATVVPTQGVVASAPFAFHGPRAALPPGARPARASFYVRVDGTDADAKLKQGSWGTAFVLHAEEEGEDGNATAAAGGLVGVAVTDAVRHGAGFAETPGELGDSAHAGGVYAHVQPRRWYHIDLRLDWGAGAYDVFVDRVQYVSRAPFDNSTAVAAVGLYVLHASDAWYDEIYLGDDAATLAFRCPESTRTGLRFPGGSRGPGAYWGKAHRGAATAKHDMERHRSHLSKRELYRTAASEIIPFDGDGQLAYLNDVKESHSDSEAGGGGVSAGAFLRVPGAGVQREMLENVASASTEFSGGGDRAWSFGADEGEPALGVGGDRYYWYGEHEGPAAGAGGALRGGVGACSTDDFITWRSEGIVLYYANLTDHTARGGGAGAVLAAERPKVIYNPKTEEYVMWMGVRDGASQTEGGLAGVATSLYPGGPFDLRRTFYPDGNATRDQTLYQDRANAAVHAAYLGRTFYADVEFVLPDRQMQPLWESVKRPDGSTDFGLSYHRAFYHSGYDDFHDIFLQRWRGEDRPWKVVCVARATGTQREVARGTVLAGNQSPRDRNAIDGSACIDDLEYKLILGQGYPAVETRFRDPLDPKNSYWSPDSVPGVKAQPWRYNYQDGECGLRKMDDDLERLDPDIPHRQPPERGACSNVRDNPVHPSRRDRLVGLETAALTRRAKYVAVSRLSDDYLSTSAVVAAFEAELEGGQDMMALLSQFGEKGTPSFDWQVGGDDPAVDVADMGDGADTRGSTFLPPVRSPFAMKGDWDSRFHQFEGTFGDRAKYSQACTTGGDCPVSFRDEVERPEVDRGSTGFLEA